MKTRTLLLLALGCGLAILAAGGVLLFQLAGQDEVVTPTAVGTPAQVGDMTVVVRGADETGGVLAVEIEIGGVDDPDGAAGFRLIASGRLSPPSDDRDGGDDGDECAATTVDARTCTLRFDVSAADGDARDLFYERGDDTARWALAETLSQ